MAEQADAELIEGDVLDDEVEGLEPETEQEVENDQPEASEEDDEEVEVTFGDEAAPASGEGRDSTPIRTLRERNREQAAEIARLKAQIPQPKPPEAGPKPTLEGCEYDEERYDSALLAWNADKAKVDEANAKRDKETQAQREEFEADVQRFTAGKADLKAKDFDIAEGVVTAALNEVQLAALVVGASDPARLVYALGKHPEKLKALAAISNPVKLAVAAAKLEGSMKFAPKTRRAPEPEGIVRGGAPNSQQADKKLERLEAEADRTGDRTKIVAYKRSLKSKA